VQLRNKSYRSLSGGQQQRVLLARALCATEKLLLLDEPVTGLDPHATKQLYQILDRLHRNGTAIIMITHDIKAIDHASHVLHLDAKKPFFGTKTRYLESKQWKILKEWERGEENVC
jgi:zinc transport system ATP-binding protein